MRRLLECGWTGTYLLVALAACGCQHSRTCCSGCGASAGCGCLSKWACWGDNAGKPNPTAKGSLAGSPSTKLVLTTAKAQTAGDIRSSFIPSSYAPTTTVVPEVREQRASASADATAVGTSSADAATEPRYGHDANYHQLIGVLDYSRIQEAWVLRYVSWEDDDRYGGSVTLVVPSRMMRFRAGQTVRVEGEMIDPESRQLRPAFQVRSMHAAGS